LWHRNKLSLSDPSRSTRDFQANSVEGLGELDIALSDLQIIETQLRAEPDYRGSFPSLKFYLDTLHAHIEATCPSADASFVRRDRTSSASVSSSDGPDSAIGMNEEPPWKLVTTPIKEYSLDTTFPIAEVDERPYEFEDAPIRAPTPPPKSAARVRQSSSEESRNSDESARQEMQQETPEPIFAPVIPRRSASVSGHRLRPDTKAKEPIVFVTKLTSTKEDTAPGVASTPTPAAKATRMGRLFNPSQRSATTAILQTKVPQANKPAAPLARRHTARNPMKRLSWIWDPIDGRKGEEPWRAGGMGGLMPTARF
jgi:hypothetical protein